MTPAECAGLSVTFRQGLLAYDLMPNERQLAHLLCLATFDAGAVRGRVALDDWAAQLALQDSKGLRPDKCAVLLKTLTALGVVDVNPSQATFEPRPDASLWSRARAYRARALSGTAAAGPELPLRDERLLPEMLSELNRQAALGQTASSEKSADNVGEIRRSPEKSAEPVQRSTFNRFNVQTNKRLEEPNRGARAASEKSAEVQVSQVQAAVRGFVGESDWAKYWARAGYLWANPERVASLEESLNYVVAGVRSGELMVKTTRGAALWSQTQIDWRKLQRVVLSKQTNKMKGRV